MIQSAKQQQISKKNLHLFDKTQTPGKIGRGFFFSKTSIKVGKSLKISAHLVLRLKSYLNLKTPRANLTPAPPGGIGLKL